VPGLPGRALAGVYTKVVQLRNRRFDRGRRVIAFDRPVVSVGNLSMGGTGKTPMVERIVAMLRKAGHQPCIAMRGYGESKNNENISDEAALYRERFDDLPIVAQPDRIGGLIDIFASAHGQRVDCVVLDDGFQHRQIARQLDIVLLDACFDPLACRVFPAGTLREPIENISRATHLVLTHAERVDNATITRRREALESLWTRQARKTPFFCSVSRHAWKQLWVYDPRHVQGCAHAAVDWLKAKRVVGACAIGKPDAFFAAIEQAGATIAARFVLRDHDPFKRSTIERIMHAAGQHNADAIVVTAKDMTKISTQSRGMDFPCPIIVPELELVFAEKQPDTWAGLKKEILDVVSQDVG